MKEFTSKQIEITMLITTGEKKYLDISGIFLWLNISYDKTYHSSLDHDAIIVQKKETIYNKKNSAVIA